MKAFAMSVKQASTVWDLYTNSAFSIIFTQNPRDRALTCSYKYGQRLGQRSRQPPPHRPGNQTNHGDSICLQGVPYGDLDPWGLGGTLCRTGSSGRPGVREDEQTLEQVVYKLREDRL